MLPSFCKQVTLQLWISYQNHYYYIWARLKYAYLCSCCEGTHMSVVHVGAGCYVISRWKHRINTQRLALYQRSNSIKVDDCDVDGDIVNALVYRNV